MSLDPSYLRHVSDEIEDIWLTFETEAIEEIAKRIASTSYTTSSTIAFQYTKMREYGLYEEYIQEQIAKYLNISKKQVADIINDSVAIGVSGDLPIYKEAKVIQAEAGFSLKPFSGIINKGIKDVMGDLQNWTKSFYGKASGTLLNELDLAYLNVSSGLMTQNQAVEYAINNLANKGVNFSVATGRIEQATTIVSRAVRTGVNITDGRVSMAIMDDLGCDLVETSSHLGARFEHSLWQGKVFSRSGQQQKYPDFITTTLYGQGEGICGWNCRHSFYPYYEGLSTVSARRYSLIENERVYKLEQQQNYNQRMINKWKREKAIKEAGGVDSSIATRKVKEWNTRNNEFIKANSDVLKYDYSKMRLEKLSIANSYKQKIDIGTFNPKVMTVINDTFENVQTDKVIMNFERLAHIREKHPEDIAFVEKNLWNFIYNPDYLYIDSKRENTILSAVKEDDYYLVAAIKLITDNSGYKNSIITSFRRSKKRFEKFIADKYIYKK